MAELPKKIKEQEYPNFLFCVMCYLVVIIVQEPEILVYHRVGHNITKPFAIAVYKGTTTRLRLG